MPRAFWVWLFWIFFFRLLCLLHTVAYFDSGWLIKQTGSRHVLIGLTRTPMGLAHAPKLKGLVHKHMLVGLDHEHKLLGLAHECMFTAHTHISVSKVLNKLWTTSECACPKQEVK